MSDPVTPNIGLTKPTVGADSGVWGGLLNTNFDLIDAKYNALGKIASGSLSVGGPTWDASGNVNATGEVTTTQLTVTGGAGADITVRSSGSLRIIDFSLASGHKLVFNNANDVLTYYISNVAIFSIDSAGNVIAKGTITASGTPAT